jgi:hypothetical protein
LWFLHWSMDKVCCLIIWFIIIWVFFKKRFNNCLCHLFHSGSNGIIFLFIYWFLFYCLSIALVLLKISFALQKTMYSEDTIL